MLAVARSWTTRRGLGASFSKQKFHAIDDVMRGPPPALLADSAQEGLTPDEREQLANLVKRMRRICRRKASALQNKPEQRAWMDMLESKRYIRTI